MCVSCSVVFDRLWSHELLCPWDSPGKNTGGLPFPSPGYLPDPGIEPRSPAWQEDAWPSEPPRKPCLLWLLPLFCVHQVPCSQSLWRAHAEHGSWSLGPEQILLLPLTEQCERGQVKSLCSASVCTSVKRWWEGRLFEDYVDVGGAVWHTVSAHCYLPCAWVCLSRLGVLFSTE